MNQYLTKKSYGVIVCRYNSETGQIEGLLINKRCTYDFSDFINCKWYKGNKIKNYNTAVSKYFDNMTTDEKMIIKTLDYSLMFYWIYNESNLETKIYRKKYIKFYNSFLNKNNGNDLLNIIDNSKSSALQTPWEFPKGRKNYNLESDIECAIREFEEETNIKKSEYIIIPDLIRNQSYISNNTRYINKYFVAFIKDSNFAPNMNFKCKSMVSEVKNIQFMSITELKLLKSHNNKLLVSLAGPIFNYVKKWYKR